MTSAVPKYVLLLGLIVGCVEPFNLVPRFWCVDKHSAGQVLDMIGIPNVSTWHEVFIQSAISFFYETHRNFTRPRLWNLSWKRSI